MSKIILSGCLVLAILQCQTTPPISPLSESDGLSSLEGVWQDVKWGDLLTIRRKGGIYTVAAVIDSQSAEEFAVQSSAWGANKLNFQYRIPSKDTTVVAEIDGMEHDLLAGRWRLDDNTNSGEFRYRKILDAPPTTQPEPEKKKPVDQLLGRVYKIRENTIVIASGAMSRVGPGSKVYVLIEGKRVYLTVNFPMITIARCTLDTAGAQWKNRISEGMPVYK